MRYFTDGKVQFIAFDNETEEKHTLTIGNLTEDADVEEISKIGQALKTVVDGSLGHAQVVESYHISI